MNNETSTPSLNIQYEVHEINNGHNVTVTKNPDRSVIRLTNASLEYR